jgi:RNA polymerase sigma-70 factor (ECF subfamily)
VTGEQDEDEAEWSLDFEFLTIWRERIRAVVCKLKHSKLSSRMDTSDLVQEGMLQVFQQLDSFRGTTEQEFDAWVKRIAAGTAANANRFHYAQKRSINNEILDPTIPESDQPSPAETAEQSEVLTKLAAGIHKLDDRKRTVVLLYIFEGKTFEEIGEKVGCTAPTVSRVFNKAIQTLGRLFEPDEPPEQ